MSGQSKLVKAQRRKAEHTLKTLRDTTGPVTTVMELIDLWLTMQAEAAPLFVAEIAALDADDNQAVTKEQVQQSAVRVRQVGHEAVKKILLARDPGLADDAD